LFANSGRNVKIGEYEYKLIMIIQLLFSVIILALLMGSLSSMREGGLEKAPEAAGQGLEGGGGKKSGSDVAVRRAERLSGAKKHCRKLN
jgi:hypothetical protein